MVRVYDLLITTLTILTRSFPFLTQASSCCNSLAFSTANLYSSAVCCHIASDDIMVRVYDLLITTLTILTRSFPFLTQASSCCNSLAFSTANLYSSAVCCHIASDDIMVRVYDLLITTLTILTRSFPFLTQTSPIQPNHPSIIKNIIQPLPIEYIYITYLSYTISQKHQSHRYEKQEGHNSPTAVVACRLVAHHVLCQHEPLVVLHGCPRHHWSV